MTCPEDYVHEDPDIEVRVPKLDSILGSSNRIPYNGSFEDDYEG